MSLPIPAFNDNPISFAYPTVRKRWPTILQGAIEDIQKHVDEHPVAQACGEHVSAKIRGLLDDLDQNAEIRPFGADAVAKCPHLEVYNTELKAIADEGRNFWRKAPWLYSECHLYQLLDAWFKETKHLQQFDVFENLKNSTFKQSSAGVLELCKRYEVLGKQLAEGKTSADSLKNLFFEFADISLWGNATDLSLLAGNVSAEDIRNVQGAEVRKKNEEKIVVNDIQQVWDHLTQTAGARIDFVLDNSGFELFADLCMALFVLDSGIANSVVIHCKQVPWFVSDTMPKDFDALLEQLGNPEFFEDIHESDSDKKSVEYLLSELKSYIADGKISVQHDPFWTSCEEFWKIPQQKALYAELLKSNLIIFKGDLNYRKLTKELEWDTTTPFTEAIQDLAKLKLPVLALRTCKADVVVGLPAGLNEKLIKEYKEMGNEIGEHWTSSGKWAVISFSKGY